MIIESQTLVTVYKVQSTCKGRYAQMNFIMATVELFLHISIDPSNSYDIN